MGSQSARGLELCVGPWLTWPLTWWIPPVAIEWDLGELKKTPRGSTQEDLGSGERLQNVGAWCYIYTVTLLSLPELQQHPWRLQINKYKKIFTYQYAPHAKRSSHWAYSKVPTFVGTGFFALSLNWLIRLCQATNYIKLIWCFIWWTRLRSHCCERITIYNPKTTWPSFSCCPPACSTHKVGGWFHIIPKQGVVTG